MTTASWPEATSAYEPEMLACTDTTAPSGPDLPFRRLPPTHESDLGATSLAAAVTRRPAWEGPDRSGRSQDGLFAEYGTGKLLALSVLGGIQHDYRLVA